MVVKQGLGGWEKMVRRWLRWLALSTKMIWLREERPQEAKPEADKARITSCLPLIESLGSLYRLLTHIPFYLFSLNYNYSLLNFGLFLK
jgi:hypothetical protein